MSRAVAAGWGALVGALLLTGCAHVAYTPPSAGAPPAPVASSHYDVVPGREADVVARLRAAPPPVQPELSDGKTRDGDERLLRAQGYVQIGTGYFIARDGNDARDRALRQGEKVGAEKVLIYPPDMGVVDTFVAVYYVRLRLPFGANFRDLTADERQSLGTDGVEIGEIIGGTPASAANLREGDFVLKLNHKPVHDKAGFQNLLQAHLGRRVILTVRRDGATMNRLVVLGTLPAVRQ